MAKNSLESDRKDYHACTTQSRPLRQWAIIKKTSTRMLRGLDWSHDHGTLRGCRQHLQALAMGGVPDIPNFEIISIFLTLPGSQWADLNYNLLTIMSRIIIVLCFHSDWLYSSRLKSSRAFVWLPVTVSVRRVEATACAA